MGTDQRWGAPPDLADIERIANAAFTVIPDRLRRHITNVVIRVEDFPDAETVREMELESPFDLLGLYRGIDLTQKSVSDVPSDMDMILLFRRPLLDYWCETDVDLVHLVLNVLIHEIGHHFGLSDADMEALEREADDVKVSEL